MVTVCPSCKSDIFNNEGRGSCYGRPSVKITDHCDVNHKFNQIVKISLIQYFLNVNAPFYLTFLSV